MPLSPNLPSSLSLYIGRTQRGRARIPLAPPTPLLTGLDLPSPLRSDTSTLGQKSQMGIAVRPHRTGNRRLAKGGRRKSPERDCQARRSQGMDSRRLCSEPCLQAAPALHAPAAAVRRWRPKELPRCAWATRFPVIQLVKPTGRVVKSPAAAVNCACASVGGEKKKKKKNQKREVPHVTSLS